MERRWRTGAAPGLAAAVAAAAAGRSAAAASARQREYSDGTWSGTFFRPHEVKIEAVGIVNEDSAYVATRSGIKALRDGHLSPLVEVDDGIVKAFHLCHHRNSLFYEVQSRDGGALSIFEYSLSVRQKNLVTQFQDESPATALACIDEFLLRASTEVLRSVHVPGGEASELRRFPQDLEPSDSIASLSVAYAADVVETARVYAAVPGNRTIVRLQLQRDGETRLREQGSEVLLAAGEGADGAAATVVSPQHVLWHHGELFFTDGCSLRSLAPETGHARTVLGHLPGDAECQPVANETLEPVPWATRLSRPLALAAADEGTGAPSVLLLTEAQVILVGERPNGCAPPPGVPLTAARCAAHAGGRRCGWAEGADDDQHACFECSALERWASRSRPPLEVCKLELGPRAGVRYQLVGCGCVPPPASPGGDNGAGTIQAVLSVLLVITVVVCGVMWKRRTRQRAALQELYGNDTTEFHMFQDNNGA